MFSLPRAVYFLLVAGILVGSAMPLTVLVGGLIGSQLAPSSSLATLPITCVVVGTALSTFPVSALMRHFGRRVGFCISILVGLGAQLLAMAALFYNSFFLFCGATLLTGFMVAGLQQMRFAAVELAGKDKAPQAISVLMLHGVFAAWLGPELVMLVPQGDSTIVPIDYLIAYAALTLLLAVAAIWVWLLMPAAKTIQAHENIEQSEAATRSTFWMAVVISVTAFGVMSFVMTATPVSMHQHHGFGLDAAKMVIQAHILAMFLPSLVTGKIIAKIGERLALTLGAIIFLVSCLIALDGVTQQHFLFSLIALGIAWNILFTTGTAILGRGGASHQQQARHDFLVFSAQALATVFAGVVLLQLEWRGVLLGSLLALSPLVIVVLLMQFKRFELDK